MAADHPANPPPHPSGSPPASSGHPTYEPIGRAVRPVVIFFICFIVAAIVIHVVIGVFYWGLYRVQPPPPPGPFAAERQPPAAPRLQANPQVGLGWLLRRDEQALHTYGWIDRSRGIVHIPIEEAMRRSAQSAASSAPAPGVSR